MKPFVPSFGYQLVDLSGPSDAEIKGRVLTRLVQLAMRWVFDAQPVERLRELLALIEQIEDRDTAVEVLESLLRYFVQGTQRVDEPTVRALLQQTSTGEPIMQTFIDRYIEQGQRQRARQPPCCARSSASSARRATACASACSPPTATRCWSGSTASSSPSPWMRCCIEWGGPGGDSEQGSSRSVRPESSDQGRSSGQSHAQRITTDSPTGIDGA
jgi:hypothetical protein